MVAARHLFETSGTARVLAGLVGEWAVSKNTDFFLAVPERFSEKSTVLKKWKKRLIRVRGETSKPIAWLQAMEKASLEKFPDGKLLVFYPNLQLPKNPALPFVSLLHDVLSLHSPDYQFNPWKYFSYKREIREHLKARAVATVSHYSREDLIRNFPGFRGKVEVIWNGVSEAFTSNGAKNRNHFLHQKFGGKKYVLYVGDLRRRKNVYRLAEAFVRLPRHLVEEYVLAFTGEGPLREKIKRLFGRKGLLHSSLKDLGRVDEKELPELYRGASLFAFPSLFEGFGLPVLEAQASGVPVACGRNSSLPEVTGKAAVFFDEKKSESIRDAMGKILENEALAKKLRRAGPVNARRFSWSRSAARYEKLFAKVWKKMAFT